MDPDDNSMPPDLRLGAGAHPGRKLDDWLAADHTAEIPANLLFDNGTWIGGSRRVSYPDKGHDLLPATPDNWWYTHRAGVILRVLAAPPANAPKALWDIGGGTGLMSPALHEAGWATVNVEPIERAARQAAGRADVSLACTLNALELPSGSVPAIGLFDVVEHLPDAVDVLRECRRVLAPGGQVVMTVPAHQWLWSDIDRIVGHQARYDRRRLKMHAAAAGLRVELARNFFVALAPGAALMRLRRRPGGDQAVLERERAMLNPGPRVSAILRNVAGVDALLSDRLRLPVGLSLVARLRQAD